MTPCSFCGDPSYLGPIHPCCKRAQSEGERRCRACLASKELNEQYTRRRRVPPTDGSQA